MTSTKEIKKKLEKVFDKKQAIVLSEVISDAYSDLVKTSDFNELKGIVRELAEAQKRTEIKVEELAEAQKRTEIRVEELAEAQKRTEIRVEELAEAQKRTEIRVEELAEAQKTTEKRLDSLTIKVEELAVSVTTLTNDVNVLTENVNILAKGLDETRGEVGGLARSISYAFENEVYRMLPDLLKKKYPITMHEKIIRTEIGNKEVNIFGKADQNGKEVFVVGEAKLRLDERRVKKREEPDVFEELEDKVKAVIEEYGDVEIVRVLISHYATKGFLEQAKKKGIIVIQSFEW